jgi:hypothetical protein
MGLWSTPNVFALSVPLEGILASRSLGFQTRQHPPARTISLLLSVMIRSLQVTGPHLCLRIRTDADA